LLLKNNLLAEAQRELESVVAEDADNSKALTLLSKVYLKQKNIKSAGKLLESAVARGAADAKIYFALSEVYQAAGFPENAIPAMRLAIEKEPENDFYQARYGLLLIDSKAPAAAIIRMNEAARKFPQSAKIKFVLGIAQFSDGRNIEAEESLKSALKQQTDFVPALAYLGTVYAERGQFSEAAAFYERALAVEAENAVLHYLLADTLLKIQGSERAKIQKHLESAIRFDEQLAGAHLALGQLLARDGNWEKAAARFEQAIRFAPESAEAYYQLGRSLARLKRAEESKVMLEKFKKLNETQTAQRETNRRELVRRLANVRF
jgi:tetratricopeptide (TPR) repeat protein